MGFAAIALVILWQAVRARYPVIVLTPDGLHDIRVTRSPIRWGDVEDASLSKAGHQWFVIVAVSKAGFYRAKPKSQGRPFPLWTVDQSGARLGLATALLDIHRDDLLAAVARHIAEAHDLRTASSQ